MFKIKLYDGTIVCRTLKHGEDVFHRAHEGGEGYYHVLKQDGSCYDIEYLPNSDNCREEFPIFVRDQELIPDYSVYDEHDTSLMDMGYLDAHNAFICHDVNEYSLVIAKIVLKYTHKDVYFSDKSIYDFIEDQRRLHVVSEFPDIEGALIMTGPEGRAYYAKSDPALGHADMAVFHSLFIPQWLFRDKDRSKLKYVDFMTPDSSKGIVSLLNVCNRMETYFDRWGLKVIITGDHMAKYDVHRLRQYFRLHEVPADADEENTLILRSNMILQASWRFQEIAPQLHLDMFTDRLRNDMELYKEAVFAGRKALGVLIRGTDYLTMDFSGEKVMAKTSDMIPFIREWIERDGYEMIFLATEDKDALNEMISAFGKMVYAIGQERHTLEEVQKTKTIDALERKLYSPKDYDDRVMETTVNYMYALYMLAHCNSLITSGRSNGVDLVKSLNEGKYTRYYQFFTQKQ